MVSSPFLWAVVVVVILVAVVDVPPFTSMAFSSNDACLDGDTLVVVDLWGVEYGHCILLSVLGAVDVVVDDLVQ